MVRGAENGDKIVVKDYSEDELEAILENYFMKFD